MGPTVSLRPTSSRRLVRVSTSLLKPSNVLLREVALSKCLMSGHQCDLPRSLNAQDHNRPRSYPACGCVAPASLINHGTGSALQRVLELGLDAFELAVEDLPLLPVTRADTLSNHTSQHSASCRRRSAHRVSGVKFNYLSTSLLLHARHMIELSGIHDPPSR